MKKEFPGHYEPTPSAFRKLWRDALFVFDASSLLNLYGFSREARDDLVSLLKTLKDSLWMPHQFALEYQRNRRKVIREQMGIYAAVTSALTSAEDQFTTKAKDLLDKERFVRKEVKEALTSVFKMKATELEEHRTHQEKLLAEDRYHAEITKMFKDRIGPRPTHEDLVAMARVAKERFELFIPPGWADTELIPSDGRWRKKGDAKMHPFGDYFGWAQILAHAKKRDCPVILICDDMKEDWWLLEPPGRLPVSPRPELRTEFQLEVGQEFYMYRLDSFVVAAPEYGRGTLAEATLAEAKERGAAAIKAAKARSGEGQPKSKKASTTDADVTAASAAPKMSAEGQQKSDPESSA